MESTFFDSIEQLENGTPSDKVIVLKSVFKQGKTTVMPTADGNGWYKGVPRLSDEDKRKLVHWAEPTSKKVIREGTTFDLNNEVDRITWAWVKHAPCICATKEEVQHTPGAEFYIYLENEEAKTNISRHELRYKATDLILKDNAVNYPMRAELLGINMDGESPLVIKEYLMDQANRAPEKIIAIYKSKDISAKLLLLKALKKGVVREEGGLFMFGSNVLGTTQDSSVKWLANPENAEIVRLLEREADPEYFSKLKKEVGASDLPKKQGSAPRS